MELLAAILDGITVVQSFLLQDLTKETLSKGCEAKRQNASKTIESIIKQITHSHPSIRPRANTQNDMDKPVPPSPLDLPSTATPPDSGEKGDLYEEEQRPEEYLDFTPSHPQGTLENTIEISMDLGTLPNKGEKIAVSALKNIAMEGYLDKLGGRNQKTWQRRYCVLAGPLLYFFEKENSKTYNNCIALSTFTSSAADNLTNEKKKQYVFKLSHLDSRTGKKKDYHFRCTSSSTRDRWLGFITKALSPLAPPAARRSSEPLPPQQQHVTTLASGSTTSRSTSDLSAEQKQQAEDVYIEMGIPEEEEDDEYLPMSPTEEDTNAGLESDEEYVDIIQNNKEQPPPLPSPLTESAPPPLPRPLKESPPPPLPRSLKESTPTPLPRSLSDSAPPPLPRPLKESPPPPLPRPLKESPPPPLPRPLKESPPPPLPKPLTESPPPPLPRPLKESPPPPLPRPLKESPPPPLPTKPLTELAPPVLPRLQSMNRGARSSKGGLESASKTRTPSEPLPPPKTKAPEDEEDPEGYMLMSPNEESDDEYTSIMQQDEEDATKQKHRSPPPPQPPSKAFGSTPPHSHLPPAPSIPAPPPPEPVIEADRIYEQLTTSSIALEKVFVAVWDFAASEEDELALRKGDLVYVNDPQSSVEWWFGELLDASASVKVGKAGVFPRAYSKTYLKS